jgi:hypothetical protein
MASEECWKKKHLERNAEVDAMIQNAIRNFAHDTGVGFGTPGR